MLCLVRKSLILLFKKRLFKTLYTMYSTVHSKATVTGHQIVPADRQLKIAQLGVCWEAPSFQESLEPHVTEDTSSVKEALFTIEWRFKNSANSILYIFFF